jgi:microcystin-dependent protein
MTTPFLGQITVFPYHFPPSGWADCAGQLLPISQHGALFSLIGTKYGGDGRGTFGLPNLQGSVPVGQGQGPGLSNYSMGETGGTAVVLLNPSNNPSHSHGLGATTAKGSTNASENASLATVVGPGLGAVPKGLIYNSNNPNTTLAPQAVGAAGGGQPHNNMQPYLALRYCIALTGVFPSRG